MAHWLGDMTRLAAPERRADQQRHPDKFFIPHLLRHQAVRAHPFAMVGSLAEDPVLHLAGGFQRPHDVGHLLIYKRAHAAGCTECTLRLRFPDYTSKEIAGQVGFPTFIALPGCSPLCKDASQRSGGASILKEFARTSTSARGLRTAFLPRGRKWPALCRNKSKQEIGHRLLEGFVPLRDRPESMRGVQSGE